MSFTVQLMLASLQQCWLCLMHLLTRPCAALLLQPLRRLQERQGPNLHLFERHVEPI